MRSITEIEIDPSGADRYTSNRLVAKFLQDILNINTLTSYFKLFRCSRFMTFVFTCIVVILFTVQM